MTHSKSIIHAIKSKSTVILAFCLTAVASMPANAEDIEIYTGLTGELTEANEPSEQKPNILFVLDTSGSMGKPEVILNARPPYVSSQDYGAIGEDDNVYVYDDNRNYTGMFVENSNNNCKNASDLHAASPEFPEYVDRALVWEYIEEGSEQVETCTDETVETYTDTSNRSGRWNTVTLFDVTPGEELQISFEVQSYGEVVYYFWDSNEQKINNQNYCYQFIDDFEKLDCPAVTVPDDAVRLRTRYYPYDEFFGDNITATLTKGGTCTTTTQSIPGSADWVVDADDDSEILALECELDSGIHGENDTSDKVYTRYQGNNSNNLTTPKYTSAAGNSNAVDWKASALEERLIVPGNYHDYLQSSVSDLFGAGTTSVQLEGSDSQDVVDYCVEEGNVITIGGSGTQTYLHGGHFVEHDGFVYECQTRIGALKDATSNIISSMTGANVGLMRFNTEDGGSLISAIVDVDASAEITDPTTNVVTVTTNKAKLTSEVRRLPGAGATPLQETLYEAYLYFAGKTPASTSAAKNVATVGTTIDFPISDVDEKTSDITDPLGLEDGKYKSPILNQCQDNNIILFSDGSATSDVGRADLIAGISGRTCSDTLNGDCLDELAYAMANKDVNDDIKLDNHVYLHTIGFGSDLTGTSELVDASNEALRPGAATDSQHYEATSTEELVTAFQSILLSIGNVEADSFIAPAVAVNAFNRLQFRNDLYFALFEPTNTPRWNGNIKKYKVTKEGTIIDEGGNVAVDDSGFFHENSKSYWSDIVDGNEVTKGGAARELGKDLPRNLFANVHPDRTSVEVLRLTDQQDFVNKVLTSDTSSVSDLGQLGSISLTDLIDDLLDTLLAGGTGTSEGTPELEFSALDENVRNIVDFTFGYDIDQELEGESDEPNFYLGESLHGTPYVLDFGKASITETGTPLEDDNGDLIRTPDGQVVYEIERTLSSTTKDVLFFTTNQGMLHAVDGDTGEELWAYIPDPDLFENLGDYYNRIIDDDHTYGLDGEVEFVVNRSTVTLSQSGILGQEAIETQTEQGVSEAKMYFGQRRGGSKYFALDVLAATTVIPDSDDDDDDTGSETTEISPVNKIWTIGSETLQQMGQSWAKPIATKISYCNSAGTCGPQDVLVISGGYDTKYDDYKPADSSNPSPSTWLEDIAGTVKGNAIYIVDRDSGNLLWTAGASTDQVNTSVGYSIFPEMTHGFVSAPTVIDTDFDGIADLMFAVDLAGRIWRIDFRGHVYTDSDGKVVVDQSDIHAGDNGSISGGIKFFNTDGTGLNEVSGGIIADLSETDVNRLFYNKLDVSLVDRTNSDKARYNIVAGSGYRAHPLLDEGVSDTDFRNRLYFVFDRHLQFPKAIDSDSDDDGLPNGITYNYANESDGTSSLTRIDATTLSEKDNSVSLNIVTKSVVDSEEQISPGNHYHGFYLELATGSKEKMINPTLTNDGIVLAVSYSPTSVVTNAIGDICEKNIGSSSLYQIDLSTGEAARLDLAKAGISTKPIVIEVDAEDPDNPTGTVKVLIIGSESFDASKDLEVIDGDIDKLLTPSLKEPKIGQVNRANWWERRK